ncbi:hypothetical protein STXM2123_5255 [Streptomyces sp. F-3]|nr:hypothetical protein STXM2123_5255 [Streptomyces sp. F-3]
MKPNGSGPGPLVRATEGVGAEHLCVPPSRRRTALLASRSSPSFLLVFLLAPLPSSPRSVTPSCIPPAPSRPAPG